MSHDLLMQINALEYMLTGHRPWVIGDSDDRHDEPLLPANGMGDDKFPVFPDVFALRALLVKRQCEVLTAHVDAKGNIDSPVPKQVPESRATRLAGDPKRLLFLKIHRKIPNGHLRALMSQWVDFGIQLGHPFGRYSFLGFTESGLKSGQLLFFKEDRRLTVQVLTKNLDAVYLNGGYGRFAARLQLSFSSTIECLQIPNNQVVQVPDLQAEDGSLSSDGCGMIRESVARSICETHKLPIDTSVFQIRRGGIKGLLVSYPDEDFDDILLYPYQVARPNQYSIMYHPSMLKYEGGPSELELLGISSCPPSARLHRHFIILLLSRGISLGVFKRLMQEQIDLVRRITDSRDVAIRCLRREMAASPTSNKPAQEVYEVMRAGHELKEPFVESKLVAFQNNQYRRLKENFGIPVESSCYLYGVIDEYGLLDEGYVFISLTGRSVPQGVDVLVGRNPSFCPEDLRVFRTADNREMYRPLGHLRNCIVFSQISSHSVPDTMASGYARICSHLEIISVIVVHASDLDGDKYFVTWDPLLIPTSQTEYRQPVSFVPLRNWSLQNIKVAAVETFVELRFNYLLGTMVNEWERAALADPRLARGQYPRELARLIESTLDMVKSGESPRALSQEFQTLRSQSSLGLSTRTSSCVNPIQVLRELVPQERITRMNHYNCDKALLPKGERPAGWLRHISDGAKVINQFGGDLQKALDSDTLENEYGNTESQTLRETDKVRLRYMSHYFGGGTRKQSAEQEMRASAWYALGYKQKKQSFAWLGMRYLNKIKAESTAGL
ncbi:hypothetical protein JAAARDRAFT_208175 [Jaapia argillacea MUCL 33604]|uniref:RNA-dependent RNA polymerase n=1 Tax=Jaapia argillacea MUCL 33604 TaxID=933084 RepID=A0A067PLX4_9AGAM|nr:hypothetical protein JAAARDRAFT_208175 [Jaapia argillacea MUCL 33604]